MTPASPFEGLSQDDDDSPVAGLLEDQGGVWRGGEGHVQGATDESHATTPGSSNTGLEIRGASGAFLVHFDRATEEAAHGSNEIALQDLPSLGDNEGELDEVRLR